MIYQRKEHAFGTRRHGAQPALHRSGLAELVIGIDHENRRPGRAGANLIGGCAQHHDDRRALLRQQPAQRIQERGFAVSQQRFRRAHAARFAGGQDQAGGHFASVGRADSAITDIESERQLEAALRRTAIISAVTETAISSGEIAPISSPMGAWIFSKASRGMPSFSSSRNTLSTLRRLPIMRSEERRVGEKGRYRWAPAP